MNAVPGATTPLAAAVEWAVSQLPSSSPVFCDAATAQLLTRVGHPAVPVSVWSWRRAGWTIITPGLRDEAPDSTPVTSALAATIPVAVFGGGSDRVVIARLVPGRTSAVAAAVAADARERRNAAAALLRNGHVRIAEAARAAFTAGSVDFRADTLLAAIASNSSHGSATVVQVQTDAAEQATGLPARRLEIAFPDQSTLSDALASLPARFRPYLVQGTNRLAQLTWRVRIPPVRPLP
jgi:hypothetical protein